MGIILIIIGVIIWYAWASDIQKGEQDFSHKRLIHDHPVGGCLPYIIAFGLIGLGIFLLVNK